MQTSILRILVIATLALATTACANTIRGLGRDTANTVNATQNAGEDIAEAAD
ncbi:entericidin domain-containing protein [Aquibium oceanicum]|uniref:Entericidin n=1 Tax=Aquibium oceanicum TaxID=1670800 RepID=A0A1L3STC0_9HYPH|nr:entericidin [Aquibium oceanicum]APH72620.1 entericidin [Aquibium oceanicum]